MWLSIDSPQADDTETRQKLRDAARIADDVEHWASLGEIAVDPKLNDKAYKDANRILETRYITADTQKGDGEARAP